MALGTEKLAYVKCNSYVGQRASLTDFFIGFGGHAQPLMQLDARYTAASAIMANVTKNFPPSSTTCRRSLGLSPPNMYVSVAIIT